MSFRLLCNAVERGIKGSQRMVSLGIPTIWDGHVVQRPVGSTGSHSCRDQVESLNLTKMRIPTVALVSIVTPTRNRAHLLQSIYASVSSQDWPNIEWLIDDDGPEGCPFIRGLGRQTRVIPP
jgi:hypothetical protein